MPRRSARGLVLTLALVSALGSAAIHMLVPALPALARDLVVRPHVAQHAISFYLFGLAAGQLIAGPLSDRIGRRPVVIAGVMLYVAGAVLGAAAASIELLWLGRVIQAFGGGAGIVAARVIVGDVFGRGEAGRGQAQLMAVVLLSPAVAPVVGGYISGAFGWRAVLAVQGVVSLVALVLVWRSIRETLPHRAPAKRRFFGDYARLLRNAEFHRTAVAIALCSSALYMFLSVAPFLLIDQWGAAPGVAGIYFLFTAVTAILGAFAVGYLEKRFDAFRLGLAICLSGAALALVLATTTDGGWAALMIPAMIVTLGVGISGPSGVARVLHAEEGLAGTAASLSGALQMATGGLAALTLGAVVAPSFIALSLAMTGAIGLSWWLAPRGRMLPK